MTDLTLLVIALVGFGQRAIAQTVETLETCGSARYDPNQSHSLGGGILCSETTYILLHVKMDRIRSRTTTDRLFQYVCWDNEFLCPVIAGEGLRTCSGACYSTFMYQCTDNLLGLLPAVDVDSVFTLTVSNPYLPIDGWPINAQGLEWVIGGTTESYCPVAECPPGNVTGISIDNANNEVSMNTEVPGGQLVFLGPSWQVEYSEAHSAYIPSGSLLSGFAAYVGGGFVNLNGRGWPWVACPPTTADEGGHIWGLFAKNATNAPSLSNCTAINLKVNILPAGTGPVAWEYT